MLANWQSLARLARLGPKNSNSGADFKAFAAFRSGLAHIYGQCVPHEGVGHALRDEARVLVGGVILRDEVERGYLLFALAVLDLAQVRRGTDDGQVFAGDVRIHPFCNIRYLMTKDQLPVQKRYLRPLHQAGAGVPAVVLKTWMGHTNIHITLDTYADVFSRMNNDSMKKFEDYAGNLAI